MIIKMANSPRPGVWVLERSRDYGQTWEPWQYFADTPHDCRSFFQKEVRKFPNRDDEVLCVTDFSRIVPLDNGEVSTDWLAHLYLRYDLPNGFTYLQLGRVFINLFLFKLSHFKTIHHTTFLSF